MHVCVHTHTSHLLYLLIDCWKPRCFHILSIVNIAAVNIAVHIYLFEFVFLFSLDKYLEEELLYF